MAQFKTPTGKGAAKAPEKVSAKSPVKVSAKVSAKASTEASTRAPAQSKRAAPKPEPVPARAAPAASVAVTRAEAGTGAITTTALPAAAPLRVAPATPEAVAPAASPVGEVAPAPVLSPQGRHSGPTAAPDSHLGPKAEVLRHAMGEAVSASAHGALAVNDKVIEALQTQSHAALDLWRTTLAAPHLSDVVRLQREGARQAYETASVQWKGIAETTAHWFNKTVEPLSSAISDLKR